MEIVMGIMVVLMLVAALGSGHLPMMGGHGKAGQTQESVTSSGGEKDCQQCTQQEKTEKSDETPAN